MDITLTDPLCGSIASAAVQPALDAGGHAHSFVAPSRLCTGEPSGTDGRADERIESFGVRKKRFRDAKRPEFVQVPRAALQDRRFSLTAAVVLGVLVYTSRVDGDVALDRVAGWIDRSRSNVSRAAKKLRQLGFIDEDNRVVDGYQKLFERAVDGYLRIRFVEIEKLGLKEAAAFEQLRSFQTLKFVRHFGKRFEVGAQDFGSLLGVSAKTAVRWLYRLAETVVDVTRSKGHSALVRILGEREQKSPAPKTAKATSRATAAEVQPTQPANEGERVELADRGFDLVMATMGVRPRSPA